MKYKSIQSVRSRFSDPSKERKKLLSVHRHHVGMNLVATRSLLVSMIRPSFRTTLSTSATRDSEVPPPSANSGLGDRGRKGNFQTTVCVSVVE